MGASMYYGFDLGGSKLALGVYDESLSRVGYRRVATSREDYAALLAALETLIHEADRRYGTCGRVGIGIPGLQRPDGTLFCANVPAAMDRPLARDLAARVGREVRVENDANCFTLSEAWDSAAQAYPSVLGIILGTGVGGGLAIDGRVYRGANGVAGEFGHLRLPLDALDLLGADTPRLVCGCGQRGCMENYISGRGFAWLYHYVYGEALTAPQIVARYREGDARAQVHVARFADVLAICLANLFTVLDPHLVVIGGGLSNFSELFALLETRISRYLLRVARVPPIIAARYGDDGGTRGAAFLHLSDIRCMARVAACADKESS
ncbi:N-acetylglucosamine kinase [Edwardsiella ictaluri]|nr:N-acetylglucosamine kinase [Edwardsiella ictaluri]BEI02807.1 N-acetylglucosamine kinase [Edwardsiella ictaluri]BEI06269.1 N-acetylglucosamine kinase [Edwardsiella ictaluri]BEI09729.1 N-acetylglucosamine kinase [Edwardsiella ictaluri]BEI13208.1 N-acetylglucosamine kinase [Edwardsiella ictaluri]